MDTNSPEPTNFLNWVEIKNFKSIKDLRLDCKRINVFIGKPNVGKSNILEALSMLGVEYSKDAILKGSIRYNDIRHLFYENNNESAIQVSTDKRIAAVRPTKDNAAAYEYYGKVGIAPVPGLDHEQFIDIDIFSEPDNVTHLPLLQDGRFATNWENREYSDESSPVKKYDFSNLSHFEGSFQRFLLPPDGPNLFGVVNRNDALKKEFGSLFREQGLDFVLDRDEQQFELQRREGYYVHKFPFFSIADTFRRFMFYTTAIESNKDSVLIFEEPEVNSFPPYVKAMAHRMVYSDTNQFFVSTHSPYLLQTLIGELDESELAVFITYYQDFQTHVRQLTAEELQQAQDLGIDLFYNLSRYEPNA